MCSPAAAVGMMAFGAVTQANGARDQAAIAKDAAQQQQRSALYDAQVQENNAQISEWQRQDAIRQGQKSEQALRMESAGLRSKQRVGMAANGIALESDTALDVLNSTDYLTERDAIQIRDNALRAAWGYEIQKTSAKDNSAVQRYNAERYAANAASINPSRTFITSLIGSAAQAAPSVYGIYKSGAGSTLGQAASGAQVFPVRL